MGRILGFVSATRIMVASASLLASGCGDEVTSTDEVGDESSDGESTEDTDTTGDEDSDTGTDTGEAPEAPSMPELELAQIKQLEFSWAPAAAAEYYQLLESSSPGEPYVHVGDDIVGLAASLTVPLHLRVNASYQLRACNDFGCTDSDAVSVMGNLAEAVGYLKASNTTMVDFFGASVALSADGNTLVVGAHGEGSNATGIDGNQADDSMALAGAVYVFVRDDMNAWSQQAYLKASNTAAGDHFGWSVALSADGSTLVVGALTEDSGATGIGGDQTDDSADDAGAVYVFVRDDLDAWSQQAYVKASNTSAEDNFGESVALSADGNTLVVGAPTEDSSATGIDGDQADDSAESAGAVYVFVRDGLDVWSQQTYVKASNTSAQDYFGSSVAVSADGDTLIVGATGVTDSTGAVYVLVRDGLDAWSQQAYLKASNAAPFQSFGGSVALSTDGDTLVVAAPTEASSATGIDGDQTDTSAVGAGAVYVFVRDEMNAWPQQAYVKASNTAPGDQFGSSVALSADGNTLVVGARAEASNATGIGDDQLDVSTVEAGAAYVFVRDQRSAWSQEAYVKAPNTGEADRFGWSVALSADGSTLVVGADQERSSATGISGNQADDSAIRAGAVYLY